MSEHDLGALARRLAPTVGVEIEDVYPLSPLQEGMLFHTLASGADDLYIVQQRLEIDGPLDMEVFQQAWSLVIDRHPALRTLFAWEHKGRPVQVVCRGIHVRVESCDVSTDEDAQGTIGARFEADRTQRFLLDRPPLMRIVVFHLGDDRHIMMWSQHHLLQDGWSASNVLNEVFAAYEALVEGEAPALPPVRPFVDYIEWLEARDDGGTAEFWREHLGGYSAPTHMVAPQLEAGAGGYTRRFHALTSELTTQLREFAAGKGLSLNSVLVGAFALAVARYTGRRDVAFGVVAAGRPPTFDGVEAMVGMFINTLVLRLELDDVLPVHEWLSYVQRRQADVLEHEHTPMTDVQQWSGLGAGTTLTDALFAYWSFGGTGASPSGALRYRTVDGYGRTSFPFAVTVESADPINVGLDFDRTEFDEATADQFLVHLGVLLESMVADPESPLGRLEMFTETERTTLGAYNDTQRPIPFPSVVEAFRAQALATPRDTAVTCAERTVSYAELDRLSDRIAEQIIQVGGFAAQRVAIHLPRGVDMVAAVLGVLKAGAAYVPIDRHLPAERIAYLLEDSGADLILTNGSLSERIHDAGRPVVELPLPPSEGDGLDFDIPVGPNDLAYVMYTSGSTGRPKGVMVNHRGLMNYVWWARGEYGGAGPVSFPLYTSSGFDLTITSMYVPLVSGGEVVVYPGDDARDLAVIDVFADDRVDVVKLTPSHLAVLDDDLLATERIRSVILGGEDLRTGVAHRAHTAAHGRLAIYNEYGPTEATVGCMIHRYDPSADVAGSVPIGRPVANTRIYLLDAGLSPVPVGVPGEVYVAGDGLADGYLQRPEMTDAHFVADPSQPGARMYRTGDLARRLRNGTLEFLGRADHQVKLRGHRIEPGEIEAVLTAHPAVASAAVALREPSPGDVRLVAYYVPAAGVPVNVTDLRAHLRDRLPEYMVTRHLVRVDALPLTPNGKLDRDALPDTIGEVATSTAFVAPRTDQERLVASLGAELLGVERVSITDNFFELGGHSILAMQLIARLHTETGVRVSPRVILLNTLEQAARQLPTTTPAAPPPDPREPLPVAAHVADGAIETTAYFFGPSAAPLFGMHAAPSGRAVRDRAVLLCAPLGWEYMRTHWAMRKISRILAADGFHVLRFDYFGTGDSSGGAAAATIDRWIGDIGVAAGELCDVARVEQVSLVGVRLGATFAALACSKGLPVEQLVMWDPVVRGGSYLRTLERMHGEMLAERGDVAVTKTMQGDELLGFPYPADRRREIEGIDLTDLSWPAVPTTIVTSQPRSEYTALAGSNPAVHLDHVEDVTAWDDLASSQSALLPHHIPSHIARILGGGS